jgi:MFS family permease
MHYAWIILICCCLIGVGSQGTIMHCLGLYLVPVTTEFEVGAAAFGLYFTIQGLALAFFASFAGKTMTKYGVKRSLIVAAILNACLFVGFSMAQNIYWFYIICIFMGMVFPVVMLLPIPALLNAWFEEKNGTAMGIAMMVSGLGAVVMNLVLSKIIEVAGWRMGYLSMAVVSLLLILPVTLLLVKDTPQEKGLLPYGHKENVQTQGIEDTQHSVSAKGVEVEGLLKMPVFWMTIVVLGLTTYVSTYSSYLPAHGISLGLTVVASGSLVSAAQIGNMAGSVLLGRMVDKIGAAKTEYIMGAIVLGGLILLTTSKNYIALLLAAAVFGVISALYATMTPLLVKEIFGTKNYTTIYGYIMSGMNIISAIGCFVIGWLFDITGSYYTGFITAICALACVLALVKIIFRKNYY